MFVTVTYDGGAEETFQIEGACIRHALRLARAFKRVTYVDRIEVTEFGMGKIVLARITKIKNGWSEETFGIPAIVRKE